MRFDPRWIVGKTVASVDMRPFPAGQGYGRLTAHNPVITFTDGSSIQFHTEETADQSYGTTIIYRKSS